MLIQQSSMMTQPFESLALCSQPNFSYYKNAELRNKLQKANRVGSVENRDWSEESCRRVGVFYFMYCRLHRYTLCC